MDDHSSSKVPNVPPRDVPSKGLLERESAPAKYNRTVRTALNCTEPTPLQVCRREALVGDLDETAPSET